MKMIVTHDNMRNFTIVMVVEKLSSIGPATIENLYSCHVFSALFKMKTSSNVEYGHKNVYRYYELQKLHFQHELQHEPTCCVHSLELTFYSETTLSHGRSGFTPILFAQLFCKKQH